MESMFPTAPRRVAGYDQTEVDAFLSRVRRGYERHLDNDEQPVTAEEIRFTAFAVQRGGYSTPHVDLALERLEDVFAWQEREAGEEAIGADRWLEEARLTGQVLLNRCSRPRGRRFARVVWSRLGYSVADVDRFTTKLAGYFGAGAPLAVAEVRTVSFRAQRGGYREEQVDRVLDAVVDVMIATR